MNYRQDKGIKYNESLIHKIIKQQIKNCFADALLEHYLPKIKQTADIIIGNVVVEIQLSPITIELLTKRHKNYEKIGYQVIWLIGYHQIKENKKIIYLPKSYQKFYTNVFSNMPTIYTYDFYKKQIILYYHLAPISKTKYYFQKKKIKIHQLLAYQTLQKPAENYPQIKLSNYKLIKLADEYQHIKSLYYETTPLYFYMNNDPVKLFFKLEKAKQNTFPLLKMYNIKKEVNEKNCNC